MSLYSRSSTKVSHYYWKHTFLYICILLCIAVLSYSLTEFSSRFSADSGVAENINLSDLHPITSSDHYRWRSPSRYTIVLYESPDCKYCKKLNGEIRKNLSRLEGTFNLIYRSAPLVHLEPLAAEKTLIIECVYRTTDEKTMFLFIDDLYDHHQSLQSTNDWVIKRAQNFIINRDSFIACIQDPSLKDALTTYIRTLAQDKITSTPSIAIYYESKLVGRYAAGLIGSMRIMNYLSTFGENSDQFWSDDLFKKIQSGNL